jgi:hypothetical protein
VAYAWNRERLWAFTPPIGESAFDAWIAPQRSAAIARILNAVGKTPNSEIELANGIFQACIETRCKINSNEGSKANVRLKKVKRILRGVRKQIAFIGTDPFLSEKIKAAHGLAPSPINHLFFELQCLESELSRLAAEWKRKAKLPPALKDRRPSETEWLAGVALPLVYERNFFRRAGRSRGTGGKSSGPTVRFIAATLREIDVPYSEESIARAMSRLATLRNGS